MVSAKFNLPAPPTSQGHLDPETVAQVINSRLGGVKACYSAALKSNPNLSGRVYVEFTIGQEGKVVHVQSIKNTINSHQVEKCILNSVGTWSFPEPENGEVTVRHPFIFEQTF